MPNFGGAQSLVVVVPWLGRKNWIKTIDGEAGPHTHEEFKGLSDGA